MAKEWRRTNLDAAGSRTDDIWFIDETTGWAVNSDGKILKTEDGGDTWVQQALVPDAYLRCVSFSSPTKGWVGTLSADNRLLRTLDGGATWERVENLPPDSPGRICGLCAVDDNVIVASGTNFPEEPAGVLRTTDGGATWQMLDVGGLPTLLVDILFEDAQTGWVVGGIDDVGHPDRATQRRDVVPGVFATTDGGATWTNLVSLNQAIGEFPRGEWGWKIQKLGNDTLIVSCENFIDGAILRSDDRGQTWRRLRINDRQRNSNLEGVGFLDTNTGWVGGWGDLFFQSGATSATIDGGKTWDDANEVGFRLNRFRFLGDPVTVGYASGDTVYKYAEPATAVGLVTLAAPPMPMADLRGTDQLAWDVDVATGTQRLTVRIWDRFGKEVRVLVDEAFPVAGPRQIAWDFTDAAGQLLPEGSFILRLVADDTARSRIAHRIAAGRASV